MSGPAHDSLLAFKIRTDFKDINPFQVNSKIIQFIINIQWILIHKKFAGLGSLCPLIGTQLGALQKLKGFIERKSK